MCFNPLESDTLHLNVLACRAASAVKAGALGKTCQIPEYIVEASRLLPRLGGNSAIISRPGDGQQQNKKML